MCAAHKTVRLVLCAAAHLMKTEEAPHHGPHVGGVCPFLLSATNHAPAYTPRQGQPQQHTRRSRGSSPPPPRPSQRGPAVAVAICSSSAAASAPATPRAVPPLPLSRGREIDGGGLYFRHQQWRWDISASLTSFRFHSHSDSKFSGEIVASSASCAGIVSRRIFSDRFLCAQRPYENS
jgi:hypothetical protein